jgi:hypothetical protein
MMHMFLHSVVCRASGRDPLPPSFVLIVSSHVVMAQLHKSCVEGIKTVKLWGKKVCCARLARDHNGNKRQALKQVLPRNYNAVMRCHNSLVSKSVQITSKTKRELEVPLAASVPMTGRATG